jgi:hypothetical protein
VKSIQTRRFSASARGSNRWLFVVSAVIGAAFVVMPIAFGMFSKAPQGAVMIGQFRPFMTTARLDGYQTDLSEINAGVRQTNTSVAEFVDAHSAGKGVFDSKYPTVVSFNQEWPGIDKKMTGLMTEVQQNLGNYRAVAALPSFRLFPWFFAAPGLLILVVSLGALVQPTRFRFSRWALVVLGVGLIAAPAVFQMFSRAPKGGQMMAAFKTIETTRNVEQIQGYFGEMAEGQGAIRLEVVPALASAGLTPAQIDSRFPAVVTLDTQWVHILNGMTPMIGAMSNNVTSYQAISSLPSFPLFPWFFVAPGVVVAGLALFARPRGHSLRAHSLSVHPIPATTT